jgi:hypothetical protein
MVDGYVHNNPQYPIEERFMRLEEKVTNISCNMFLLMVDLASKLGPFGEVGGSNLEMGSEGKSEYNECQ